MKKLLIILSFIWAAVFYAALLPAQGADRRWTADVEGGWVFSGYNDVRIPKSTGTLFSLSEDLDVRSKAFFRLRLSYALSRRHEFSLLYAPLSLKAAGVIPGPVFFEGVQFPAGTEIDGLYTFNSYRLTYRYRLVDKPRLGLDVGFTAKIRDAEIALESPDLFSSKTNVGFVPLLHARLLWDWSERLGMILEADGSAAKQGRAEDVLLALTWRPAPGWRLRAGYRMVEGGADVDEVYNFAWIHYLAAGASYSF